MTDFKSAAEQQVRETLGWSIVLPLIGFGNAFRLAVSKTAELLEMTSQRDEAQKALEIAKEDIAFMRDAYTGVREFVGSLDTNDDHEDACQRGAMRKLEEAMGERLTRFLMEKGDQKLFAEAYRELRSRAASAEATIREQAERITKMRDALETIEASLCACRKLICNCHACFSKRTAAEALRGKQ